MNEAGPGGDIFKNEGGSETVNSPVNLGLTGRQL